MISIYTVEEAKGSILRRKPVRQDEFSPETIKRTEAIFGRGVTPSEAVGQIIRSIEEEGDKAVEQWSSTLDDYEKKGFKIPKIELEKAYLNLTPDLQKTMQKSASRIHDFHNRQPIASWMTGDMGGGLGQRIIAINRVGVYVPGGTAPLPSSLLMSVIPAQVAGVKEIIVCTPPNPSPSILGAAHICGLDQVFQIGGAQAIAAMAFGTETVPRVDKVVGAGNLFVTLAKQQLYGVVGLDGLAGPTETMVIADKTANPKWIAADLLAQAEHDVLASAILLTPDHVLAEMVREEVTGQVELLSRKELIAISMKNKGGIVLTESIKQAAKLANDYAPEHLCLSVANPQELMQKIDNAGGIFLGEYSYEVLGDYIAGPSHIMPTGGSARFGSPLNVLDFVKISSVIALDPGTAIELSSTAAMFAKSEGLTGHAAAAKARVEAKK